MMLNRKFFQIFFAFLFILPSMTCVFGATDVWTRPWARSSSTRRPTSWSFGEIRWKTCVGLWMSNA